MANLQDIAAIAGVTVSTVSKALNKSSDINADTRQRILELARQLNYVPKRKHEQDKSDDKSASIGIVCPEIKSEYYARIVTSLEACFKQNGYLISLGLTDFKYENEVKLLKDLGISGVRGIICITEDKRIQKDLSAVRNEYDIPLVLVATDIGIQDFDYIKIDDDLGVAMAVKHMLELGHRGIAFIGDNESEQRRDTFIRELEKNDIKVNQEYIKIKEARFEECGYTGMSEILITKEPPTAVLAAYDNIAIGALKAIREKGLKVPEDISIIGIDGINAGEYLDVPLTTIAGSIHDMARIASEIILKKIEDSDFKIIQHIEIKPELVIRKSTCSPRSRL